MRNETPAWKVYAEVFGADNPDTLKARGTGATLRHLDRLARSVLHQPGEWDGFRGRGPRLPVLHGQPPAVLQVMHSWAVSGFALEAPDCFGLLNGEPMDSILPAIETLPVLLAAGLDARAIQLLLYDGYDTVELAGALTASNGMMEYALALVQPTRTLAPPF